jgi:peptide/nickel transport system permease protein
MGGYLLRRILISVLTVLLATVVVSLLMHAVPGTIVQQMLGQTSSPSAAKSLRHFFGLDRSLPAQYGSWLLAALHGNLGPSWTTGQSVTSMIGPAFLVTLELSVLTLLLATVLGVALGLLAGAFEGRWPDTVIQGTTAVGLSTPVFWLGAMLLIGGAALTGWTPPLQYQDPLSSVTQNLQMMVLPVLSLAFLQVGAYAQYVRQAVVSAMRSPYVQTALAKGLPKRAILMRHVLRNMGIGLITFMALIFVQIMGGAVVIESLFSLPGIGRLLLTSIEGRDYPVVQGALLLVAVVAVVANLAVDLIYHLNDPRLQV